MPHEAEPNEDEEALHRLSAEAPHLLTLSGRIELLVVGRLSIHPFWAEPFHDRIPGGPNIPSFPALAWKRLAM